MKHVYRDRTAIVVLLTPALVVYAVVMLAPMIGSLGMTFLTGSPVRGFTFAGFDNIARLFSDPSVGRGLQFTLFYAVAVSIAQVALGYLLALLFTFALRRSSAWMRTLVFFPVVLPTVAVALLFQKLFAIVPQDGIVNSLLGLVGGDSISWFGAPATAVAVIVMMDLWRSVGFYAVLLYAGVVDVPAELIEAAQMDGAGGWRISRSIIFPLSWPVIAAALVFSLNGTLKVFDSVIALTNGGPGESTMPLTLYMFRTAFSYGDFGYGSTIAVLLTVVCLAATLGVRLLQSRRDAA